MSTRDWPAFKDMNWLRLQEGPGHRKVIPLAPTMKHLTYEGERYFRMPDTRSLRTRGMSPLLRTQYGGSYLWDGWWEQKLAEIEARKPQPTWETGAHP